MSAPWLVTAYCACVLCCPHGHGITAAGAPPRAHVTVACPKEMAFGTVVAIEGVGIRVCMDRGSAIQGQHLDVYLPTHQEARVFGAQHLHVRVLSVPKRRHS